jgi:hypothetical protein
MPATSTRTPAYRRAVWLWRLATGPGFFTPFFKRSHNVMLAVAVNCAPRSPITGVQFTPVLPLPPA